MNQPTRQEELLPTRIELGGGVAWEPEGKKEGQWWGHIVTPEDGFAIIRDVTHTQAKLMAKYSPSIQPGAEALREAAVHVIQAFNKIGGTAEDIKLNNAIVDLRQALASQSPTPTQCPMSEPVVRNNRITDAQPLTERNGAVECAQAVVAYWEGPGNTHMTHVVALIEQAIDAAVEANRVDELDKWVASLEVRSE